MLIAHKFLLHPVVVSSFVATEDTVVLCKLFQGHIYELKPLRKFTIIFLAVCRRTFISNTFTCYVTRPKSRFKINPQKWQQFEYVRSKWYIAGVITERTRQRLKRRHACSLANESPYFAQDTDTRCFQTGLVTRLFSNRTSNEVTTAHVTTRLEGRPRYIYSTHTALNSSIIH